VIAALNVGGNRPVVRFSFSKYNKNEEIDYTIEKLKMIYELPLVS